MFAEVAEKGPLKIFIKSIRKYEKKKKKIYTEEEKKEHQKKLKK